MGITEGALLAYAAAAGTAITVYSAYQTGQDKKDAAETNAEISRRNAAQEKDAAVAQAEKIRRAAAIEKSAANAALASSGVSVGEGTPVRINEEITKNSELDAYNTILSGSRSAASSLNQASLFDRTASSAGTASYLNAGSSLLAGAGKIGSGWKTPSTTTGGTANFNASGYRIGD